MAQNAYTIGQKTRYRITLDLTTLDDFDPHQIDWEKVLDLQPNEKLNSKYVEVLDAPYSW